MPEQKQKHTFRNVVIVIAVILVIGIIGSSTGSNDDEEETEAMTEAATEAMTEAETEMATEAETIVITPVTEEITEATKASKDILDHVVEYRYGGIDDSSGSINMFWDVYLDDAIKSYSYDDSDFIEVAIACLQQPESKEDDSDGFGISVYNADGQVIFMWNSYDDKYTITQFTWFASQTNPNRAEWKMSEQDYATILNAKNE